MQDYINKLRDGLEHPPTSIDVIRKALMDAVARSASGPQMADLFDVDELAYFAEHAAHLPAFLQSEAGNDVVTLLVQAFREYVDAEGSPVVV